MMIDLIVRETLERKLADLAPPATDLDAIRRRARRYRRSRLLGVLGAAVVVLGLTAMLLTEVGRTSPEAPVATDQVAGMDFASGLRGVYDETSQQTYLGGQQFDLGDVRDPGVSAESTPFGLVYFDADQTVRLLPADGRIRTLASPPALPVTDFVPSVGYDPSRGSVALLTSGNDKVFLTVYSLNGRLQLLSSFEVPCWGSCSALRIAGHDLGRVFVRGGEDTHVIDTREGPDASWAALDVGVLDVHNGVVLAQDADEIDFPPPMDTEAWRTVRAQSDDAILTYDGSWQLSNSPVLLSTLPGGGTLTFAVPPGPGELSLGLDSDGSVLIGRTDETAATYWDCDAAGVCVEFAAIEPADGADRVTSTIVGPHT